MAVYDTEENGRSKMTRETLNTLEGTVDFSKHVLMISDNGSCPETHTLYREYDHIISHIIFNGENIGTANALNKVWRLRQPYHECLVKIDNDVVIHSPGWLDLIEEVFRRDPKIGICGSKRKDLEERPDHQVSWFKSRLRMLPHGAGERWLVSLLVEECYHIMGTCQAYSKTLLDKIGYLYQPSVYGFDDSLASLRAHIAGFKTVFLYAAIEIDHIDPGGTEFTEWKKEHAGEQMEAYYKARDKYKSGEWDVYFNGGFGG